MTSAIRSCRSKSGASCRRASPFRSSAVGSAKAGDEVMPEGSRVQADVVLALGPMVLRRAITRYETNFHEMRLHGVAPAVKVWIRQQDELSVARVKRQIRDALPPHLRGMQLEVLSDTP